MPRFTMRTSTRRVRHAQGHTERLYRVYLGISDAYRYAWQPTVTLPERIGYSHAQRLTLAA